MGLSDSLLSFPLSVTATENTPLLMRSGSPEISGEEHSISSDDSTVAGRAMSSKKHYTNFCSVTLKFRPLIDICVYPVIGPQAGPIESISGES